MRNEDRWRPTKFELVDGHLVPSAEPAALYRGSRLSAAVMAPRYERMIRAHARGRLLDLGCGEVPFYGLYRDLVSDVVCVDWAGAREPSAHLDLEVDLNAGVPLDTGSVDTVLMTDVLEHIAAPGRLLEEIARVLRPRGNLLAAVPFLYWLHEEPHDYFRYTEHGIRMLCTQAGLEIVELAPYGGAPEVLLDIVGKHMAAVPPLAWVHYHAGRRLLSTSLGRRWSRRTEHRFPLGYCFVAERRDAS